MLSKKEPCHHLPLLGRWVSLQVRLHHATALRTSSLAVGVCTDAWSTNIHVRHPSPSHAHRMHPRHSLRCAASNPSHVRCAGEPLQGHLNGGGEDERGVAQGGRVPHQGPQRVGGTRGAHAEPYQVRHHEEEDGDDTTQGGGEPPGPVVTHGRVARVQASSTRT